MKANTSLVVGSTGLVGETLLEELCAKGNKVKALSRNPPQSLNPLIENIKVDFDKLNFYQEHFKEVEEVYICLGTTIAKAGSQKAFEKVDIDYCLETAKQSLNAGVKNLSLITSIGADSDSSNFYLRTKGIVENKISQLNFQSLSIHRPGLLIGPRKDMRLAEFIGQKMHPFINPLLFGKLSEFRCIKAKVLARAMIECSGLEDGISHYFYNDFIEKGDI